MNDPNTPEPEYDYGEDAGAGQDVNRDDVLGQLTILADLQRRAEAKVAAIEAELKIAQARLASIADKQIPELMQSVGMEKFTTRDGFTVEVRRDLKARMAEAAEAREAQVVWLEDHGQGAIVKRQFVITFPKDEMAWAAKFERDMAQRKKPLDCVRRMDVHNGQLVAALKEMKASGVDVPFKLFQAFEVTRSKIKEPR